MIGYRGAIYNSRDKEVEILTWDEDGNRISMSVPCFPYFYVENIYGSDVSVFDTKLVKKEFDTRKKREEFIKKNGLTKVFDYFPPVQQALLDTYWKNNEDEDFSKFPLKIFFLDIESVGPGEHSKPEDPFHPINVITIYDSLSKHYHVWGLQKYESLDRNITYRHFKTEYALLDSFLDFFAENRPDLISGWNCLPLTENIWMDDRILKLDQLRTSKNLFKGDEVVKFAETGTKQVFKIKTFNGTEILSSKDHIFSLYKKNKASYKNKNTILKDNVDLSVESMISSMDSEDLYIRYEKNKKDRNELTYRSYLNDNIHNLIQMGFDFILCADDLKSELKGNVEFMKTISYSEAFHCGNCYKRKPSTWLYSNLIKYVSHETLMKYLNSQKELFICRKTVNWNTPIILDDVIESDYVQLLGMIFTDGSFDKNDTISVYNTNESTINSYTNIISHVLGHEVSCAGKSTDNCYRKRISINNKIGFLMNLIYDVNFNKILNIQSLSRLSNSQFNKFYTGMFDGDGCVSHHAILISHYDNVENLKTLQNLLLWNGVVSENIPTGIGMNNYIRNIKTNSTFIKNVYENSFNDKRRERILSLKPSREAKSINKNIKGFEYDDFIISKIKSIELMEYSVPMADIETKTHYFYCNGAKVHNCNAYDIPYIIRRIDRVLGENNSNRLSPTGMIYTKNVQDDFGNVLEIFKINGLDIIDYLDAYKKFCPEKRESNKLDYVGEVELGTKKLDYGNISLYELMTTDWDTFVEYNIQDVRMLTMLEQKLKYIELVRMLAYIGCTPFETALQTVGVVVGTMSIFARKKNKKLSTFIRDKKTDYPGGFVADPIVGHHKDIITFDANSLYPNVMITCNMSNETKVGKIVSASNDNYVIRHVNGKTLEMTGKDFLSYVKRENLVLSKAKVLFSQKKKGIAADLVDVYYKKRVETKSKLKSAMIEYEDLKKSNNLSDDIKTQYENNINFLDTKQLAEKIFLNSVYGAYGNRFCSIGDDDIASSITLTGQYAIKTARKLAKQFISNKTNITDDKKLENCLLFGDTDSIGVCFSLLFPDGISDGKEIHPEAYQMANELETHLNSGMQSWAKKSLNSADPRFKFKREIMCDAGIFLAKKRYVFHILDKEGFKTNKWKYTGVELVRTTMPKAIKPYVKEIIHTMILTKSEQKTNEVLIDVYDKFKKLSINELSLVSGVNKYMKYSSMCDEFNTPKGMPCATKASYFYNLIIKKLSLLEKYEEIRTGDKVKYFYIEKPNRYMLDAIAFKNVYPEEFKTIFKIDTEKMFEKDMFKCIERFYKAMNWVCRKPNHMLFSNLEEEFS